MLCNVMLSFKKIVQALQDLPLCSSTACKRHRMSCLKMCKHFTPGQPQDNIDKTFTVENSALDPSWWFTNRVVLRIRICFFMKQIRIWKRIRIHYLKCPRKRQALIFPANYEICTGNEHNAIMKIYGEIRFRPYSIYSFRPHFNCLWFKT